MLLVNHNPRRKQASTYGFNRRNRGDTKVIRSRVPPPRNKANGVIATHINSLVEDVESLKHHCSGNDGVSRGDRRDNVSSEGFHGESGQISCPGNMEEESTDDGGRSNKVHRVLVVLGEKVGMSRLFYISIYRFPNE